MTLRDLKYYCDMCKDPEPIPKGQGFSFPENSFGIEHAHQSCYKNKIMRACKVLGMTDREIANRLYHDSKMTIERDKLSP